jgi:hypothetical protein
MLNAVATLGTRTFVDDCESCADEARAISNRGPRIMAFIIEMYGRMYYEFNLFDV